MKYEAKIICSVHDLRLPLRRRRELRAFGILHSE